MNVSSAGGGRCNGEASATLQAAGSAMSCEAVRSSAPDGELGDDDPVRIERLLHVRTECVVILHRLQDGELADAGEGVTGQRCASARVRE